MTHRINYAGLTGPGLSHDHNEDAVVLPGECFTGQREFAGSFSGTEWGMAVLDGMGGNNGGETARVVRMRQWFEGFMGLYNVE